MNIDRELVSLGFISDPGRARRRPMSFAHLPNPKKRSNNRFNKNKQYHAAYRAKVAAWRRPNGDVAVSAVSTTTQETGAVGSPTTAATSPPLRRVGTGPLAMWLP